MAKQDRSPLVDAAAEFDEQLASYARLGELFLKTPLGSVKHLERANTTLAEIASCEEKLQNAGKELVVALTAAREHQEELAQAVIAHVPKLQARNEKLHELMGELTGLAGEVGALNASIQAQTIDANDITPQVMALSERAEVLSKSAHQAELEEIATQAHTLHQRLQAIAKKLAKSAPS
jgi:chromosome segregation ATPase